MRQNIKIVTCYLFLFSFLYFGTSTALKVSRDSINKSQTNKSSKEEVILIQSAAKGSIERDKNQNATYRITLEKVMPYLSYVADRPSRTVGKISLENYLKLWLPRVKDGFQNNPPNAIIHVNTRSNNAINTGKATKAEKEATADNSFYFAIEITNPQYDNKTETLVYQGKPLIGEGQEIPEAASFEHMTLIIDNVCIGCWD